MPKKSKTPNLSEIPVHCKHSEIVEVDSLVQNSRNPNTHPDRQIELLAKIIKHQGWRSPIIVSNRSGFVVKGHGRIAAAKFLGVSYVPIDRQDYENEADEYADMVADNQIASYSEFDRMTLGEALADFENDFDMELTGFELSDIEDLKGSLPDVDDLDDGVSGSPDKEDNGELADLVFKFGEYRFEVPRETYIEWQEEIRGKVGFEPQEVITEIKRRMSL